MIAFPGLIYLDVQKSGSSFTRAFLERHVAARPTARSKHRRIWYRRRRTLVLIGCRDPLSLYLSLFRYGCDGRGEFFHRLKARNHPMVACYDGSVQGFEAWLQGALEPDIAECAGQGYTRLRPDLIGMQTARFLRLGISLPELRLRFCKTDDDVLRIWQSHGFADHVLQTEVLNQDLAALMRGPLRRHLRDPGAAEAELAREERVNQSRTRLNVSYRSLPAPLLQRLAEREAFFFNALGYPDPLSEVHG